MTPPPGGSFGIYRLRIRMTDVVPFLLRAPPPFNQE
jgi:hypothetical protein